MAVTEPVVAVATSLLVAVTLAVPSVAKVTVPFFNVDAPTVASISKLSPADT